MTELSEARITALYEFLASHPDGVTVDMIRAHLGIRHEVNAVIRGLRDRLGDEDVINVPCDPDPGNPNGPWLYRLVGTREEVRAWSENRFRDSERRLLTQRQVMASMVEGTDGRTLDGRRARVWKRHLDRAIEDLADLNAE